MNNRQFELTFDADERTSGTISRPVFRFVEFLHLYSGDTIKVLCAIPSFQNITSSNNSSTIASIAISIQNGKYSSTTQLASTVETAIQSAIAGTYTCTFDEITEKFTISNSGGNFTMTVVQDDLLYFMGFTLIGTYSASSSYTSDTVCRLYPLVAHLQCNIHDYIYRGGREEILTYIPDHTIYSLLLDNITPVLTFNRDAYELIITRDLTLRDMFFEWRDSNNNILSPTSNWIVQMHIN